MRRLKHRARQWGMPRQWGEPLPTSSATGSASRHLPRIATVCSSHYLLSKPTRVVQVWSRHVNERQHGGTTEAGNRPKGAPCCDSFRAK